MKRLRGDGLSDRLLIDMSVNDADKQLSQQIDVLVKTWGLRADCSGESLSKNDVLHSCSIGDVATISKLKPRPMQSFADLTSALGLRIVGMLSALLQQQVTSAVLCRALSSSHAHFYSCHFQAKLLSRPHY